MKERKFNPYTLQMIQGLKGLECLKCLEWFVNLFQDNSLGNNYD